MLRPGVSNAEIEQIAPLFACTPSQFNDQFVDCSDGETEKYFKNLPCMCLKDTRCTIYEKRPECCKDFPNTHKHQFTTRLFAMIEYYSICPIVFNLMEMLKLELGYRVDRR
jgi:Fe-S-cluster containining protein